jgi:hypothetical protein
VKNKCCTIVDMILPFLAGHPTAMQVNQAWKTSRIPAHIIIHTCEGDLHASNTSLCIGVRCTPLLTRGRQAMRLATMGCLAVRPPGATWNVTATEALVEGSTAMWPRPSCP